MQDEAVELGRITLKPGWNIEKRSGLSGLDDSSLGLDGSFIVLQYPCEHFICMYVPLKHEKKERIPLNSFQSFGFMEPKHCALHDVNINIKVP